MTAQKSALVIVWAVTCLVSTIMPVKLSIVAVMDIPLLFEFAVLLWNSTGEEEVVVVVGSPQSSAH